MNSKKVRVFDMFKSVLDESVGEKFHNCIVNDNNMVKKYKVNDDEVSERTLYELDEDESKILQMLRNSTLQAEDMWDSCKRKQERYERMLVDKINKEAVRTELDCKLSPVKKCYVDRRNNECIFCGRKIF